MVITFVIDCVDINNGTTVTALRTAQILKQMGNEIRFICHVSSESEDSLKDYKVLKCDKFILPIFDFLIAGNGYTFARNPDAKTIADFIKGSDVVHCMISFGICAKVRKIAKIMSIPVTSAFHLQPDTISYNIHQGHNQPLNHGIYKMFYKWLYRQTRTIHTPSETMRELMIKNGYRGDIHAISNGVSHLYKPIKSEKPEELKDKYVILMIGRLSPEKRQDLIIRAVGESKYNDKIQCIFCGQGPNKGHLKKLSKKYLKNPAIFKFCSQDELRKIINYIDLYVHASSVESEAIACIEAFVCSNNAIISDSKYSATNHFAVDEKCLFKAGDYKSLQERIEYFIEHPDENEKMAKLYYETRNNFNIDDKVKQLYEMFELEIERDKEDHELGRTYYSTRKERHRLKKLAKQAGIENPYIVKKDIFHQTTLFDNKEERKKLLKEEYERALKWKKIKKEHKKEIM